MNSATNKHTVVFHFRSRFSDCIKFLLLVFSLLFFQASFATQPIPQEDMEKLCKFPDFEKGTGTVWSEYSGGKVRYNWSETASTTTYVEFLDSSRNMKMRLFSDHGEYSVNNGSSWTRWVNGAWN